VLALIRTVVSQRPPNGANRRRRSGDNGQVARQGMDRRLMSCSATTADSEGSLPMMVASLASSIGSCK
jgi:hypothetical protein